MFSVGVFSLLVLPLRRARVGPIFFSPLSSRWEGPVRQMAETSPGLTRIVADSTRPARKPILIKRVSAERSAGGTHRGCPRRRGRRRCKGGHGRLGVEQASLRERPSHHHIIDLSEANTQILFAQESLWVVFSPSYVRGENTRTRHAPQNAAHEKPRLEGSGVPIAQQKSSPVRLDSLLMVVTHRFILMVVHAAFRGRQVSRILTARSDTN